MPEEQIVDCTNFEEDIKIDKFALDVDWEHHSPLYMKYSNAWANAYANAELKKEQRDLIEAELDAEIRTNWEEYYPGTRPTEAAIKNWIRQHDRYRTAVQELIEANRITNILAGARAAFEHRKKALESLTLLHGQQYFSRPNIPRAAQEQATEERHARHVEGLNTNRRRRAL